MIMIALGSWQLAPKHKRVSESWPSSALSHLVRPLNFDAIGYDVNLGMFTNESEYSLTMK